MSKQYKLFKTGYKVNIDVSLLDVKINGDLLKDRICCEDEASSDTNDYHCWYDVWYVIADMKWCWWLSFLIIIVVAITTAQRYSTKPELRFCAGLSPCCMSEICDGEDLWQWSWLEIKLSIFSWSTIPPKQSSPSSSL